MKTPLLFAVTALAALAQTPAPRPEFDAASIRLNTDGGPVVFNGMKSPGTFSSQNQTLKNLIQEAYGVTSGQHYFLPYLKATGLGVPIFGGPSWLGEDRWDITAKWHPAQSLQTERSQMDLMLQTLLEQRFQVKLHRETRDMPVYELTLVNPGKLKQAPCTVFDPENPSPPSTEYCGSSRLGRKGMDWTLNGAGMKISELANAVSNLIGSRIIVDKTEFTGTFDAHLRWTPGQGEVGGGVPPSPDDVSESIFTVLQDQLGLKLKTGRAPVEVIVIDNAEKPTAN